MTDEFAQHRATIAAHARWARERDRTAATAPARAGFLAKLEAEARERLGPDASDEQVAKAATSALSAHYARMRLASARTRRARRAAPADDGHADDGGGE